MTSHPSFHRTVLCMAIVLTVSGRNESGKVFSQFFCACCTLMLISQQTQLFFISEHTKQLIQWAIYLKISISGPLPPAKEQRLLYFARNFSRKLTREIPRLDIVNMLRKSGTFHWLNVNYM